MLRGNQEGDPWVNGCFVTCCLKSRAAFDALVNNVKGVPCIHYEYATQGLTGASKVKD